MRRQGGYFNGGSGYFYHWCDFCIGSRSGSHVIVGKWEYIRDGDLVSFLGE